MAAEPKITCESAGEVAGWTGEDTRAKLSFKAGIRTGPESEVQLIDAEISGAYNAPRGDIKSNRRYRRKLRQRSAEGLSARTHLAYGPLADYWYEHYIILPINFDKTGMGTEFPGHIDVVSDESENLKQTIKVSCKLFQ